MLQVMQTATEVHANLKGQLRSRQDAIGRLGHPGTAILCSTGLDECITLSAIENIELSTRLREPGICLANPGS